MTDKPEAARHIYREDGGKWLVAVLSDATDTDGMRAVKLECIEELRPSPIHGSIPAGQRWTSRCRVGWEHVVGWTLTVPS